MNEQYHDGLKHAAFVMRAQRAHNLSLLMRAKAYKTTDNYTWVVNKFEDIESEFKRIKDMFPPEFLTDINKQTRKITLWNGSTIQIVIEVAFPLIVI